MDKALRDCLPVLLSDMDADTILRHIAISAFSPMHEEWSAYAPVKHAFIQALEIRGDGAYTSYEARSVYDWLSSKMHKGGIFGLLSDFSSEVLREQDGEVVCRHEQILRWRDTTHPIGQMPFVCSYLAKRDSSRMERCDWVKFPVVLPSDNLYLRAILEHGIAENHHHLKGAAPSFLLSWLSLMNDMSRRLPEFKKALDHSLYEFSCSDDFPNHIYGLVWKAALIRAYLFARMTGKAAVIVDIEKRLYFALTYSCDQCAAGIPWLKDRISDLNQGLNLVDYALLIPFDPAIDNGDTLFSGEATFQYQAFSHIFRDTGVLSKREQELFYVYLIISCKLRRELVQCNGRIGFDNFNMYQSRKDIFIDNRPKYRPLQIWYPLKEGILNKNIRKFETRFVPGDKWKGFLQKNHEVRQALKRIASPNRPGIFYRSSTVNSIDIKKLYLVAHIPKLEENLPAFKHKAPGIISCRNKAKREEARRTALILSWYLRMAKDDFPAIRGIDACNSEMGCRPEVFAQAFRFLREQKQPPRMGENKERGHSLRVTYHVGEDFLDISDGLRAMDEAMLYFDMRAGDRLGHALALGLNPKEWYQRKGRRIFLTRHDMLDNATWMLQNLRQIGKLSQALEDELEWVFLEQFSYVYKKNIPFQLKDYNVLPQEYYRAWLLRGDDPECYEHVQDHLKFHRILRITKPGFESHRFLRTGAYASILDGIRYGDPSVCQLYYSYHFDEKVRNDGKEVVEYQVSDAYIDGVCTLQKIMAQRIAQANIGIETNPTSNYLISSIKRYDEHPILSFNDNGLVNAPDNPHLLISINTDDAGVFETSLENEYALLARALEQMAGENGKLRFSPSDIYKWLDQIREMGLRLSWKKDT